MSLHLGNEYLQIHTDEPFQFNKGAGGFANTVFHLSEIVRVELSSAHPGELVVVIGSGKSRKVVLRSNSKTHAHEIVRSIANAKSRLSKTSFKFSNNGDTQLYQTLESSLGSFLNISFASLCSMDPSSKLRPITYLPQSNHGSNLIWEAWNSFVVAESGYLPMCLCGFKIQHFHCQYSP